MRRSFYITEHALVEMDNDDLEVEDVMRIAESGTIIEEYPRDRPYPSCLKLGRTEDTEPIHVVCATSTEGTIHIITAYRPDQNKWDSTFKIRIR